MSANDFDMMSLFDKELSSIDICHLKKSFTEDKCTILSHGRELDISILCSLQRSSRTFPHSLKYAETKSRGEGPGLCDVPEHLEHFTHGDIVDGPT